MTKHQAIARAKQRWGWTGGAFRKSTLERDHRFSVGFIHDVGEDQAVLVIAGHGDSYEAAFEMADSDKAAKEQEEKLTVEAERIKQAVAANNTQANKGQ